VRIENIFPKTMKKPEESLNLGNSLPIMKVT